MPYPPINIAILNTDLTVPYVRETRGLYSDIFADSLHNAARRIGISNSTPAFCFQNYDAVQGEYPSDLETIDAIIISGSSASVYDPLPWIPRLAAFIQETYAQFPHIRFFGSCFGHQVLCHSLLGPYGGHVAHNPKGWEVGVQPVRLTNSFIDALQDFKSIRAAPIKSTELRLQFVHQDQVVVSADALLNGWMVVGSSDLCAVQGTFQPGRVLTFQGHFEFDRFVNSETVKVFGALWDRPTMEAALMSINVNDDSEFVAELAAEFLIGRNGQYVDLRQEETGLLTPPDEDVFVQLSMTA